jgi:hypothetical protein
VGVSVFRIGICAAVFLVASAFAALADAPKLALIITNKAYPASIGVLENTHRDGERISATLAALGFAVAHRRDLDKAATVAAVADYVDRLEKAGPETVGFFYYAGHGAANSKYGDNYLIPIDAPIASDSQLALQAVKIGEIIDSIAATSAKTNFLVFDACRNVPMSFSVRSATRGLRAEGHRQGMLIAFATDPGKTATDEGVYAEALADEMQKPGVLATEVFRAVRSRVLAATEQRQFPWIEDGLIDNMYFKAPANRPDQDQPKIALAPKKEADPVSAVDLVALGRKYESGKGVPQNKNEAARLYRKAADLGDASGLYSLASLYHRGQGIGQDKAEAVRLLRKAIALGHPASAFVLGGFYVYGDNVPKDYLEAARLFRMAAEQGHAGAINSLGWLYNNGMGVARNPMEAARLYRKAASLGNAAGMQNLAEMHDRGVYLERNPKKAAELIIASTKKRHDYTLNQAPFGGWSPAFRRELQLLLKAEGVYQGPIDGKASDRLRTSVLELAAKSTVDE